MKTDRRGFLRLLGIGAASAAGAGAVLAKAAPAPPNPAMTELTRQMIDSELFASYPGFLRLNHTHALTVPELPSHQHTFAKGTRMYFRRPEAPEGWAKVGDWEGHICCEKL